MGYKLSDIVEIDVFSYLDNANGYKDYIKAAYIDDSCQQIGHDTWSMPFSGGNLEKVVFKGRTYAEIARMQYYPWGISDVNKIIALDDTIIPTKVTYTQESGLPDWEYDIMGELSADFIPNISSMQSIDIGNRVLSIGDFAFQNCTGLTSVTIPESVSSIKSGAFDRCTGLSSLTIPDSVTFIGNEAFWCCSCLTSITIPENVTSIGRATFYNCYGLTSMTIPNSVMEIGEGAFTQCSSLTDLTIGDNVTSIGNLAFSYCGRITSVTIPDSVTSIGRHAFRGCSGITELTIGNSVTNIGDYAFRYCSGLTRLTIPSSVTSIGENAFAQCPDLMDVTFVDKDKATVQGMDDYSWGLPYNCLIHCTDGDITPADLSKLLLWKTDGQMVEVVAPERVTSQTIEQAVYPSQRNTIARAHIPDNVTSIDYGAFFGCDSLTGINIGNCVTSLGSDLFWNCTALSTLTIPSSVESIGENAFYNCSSLTDVTFNGKTLEQVRAMNQYPWGISDTSIIHVQG